MTSRSEHQHERLAPSQGVLNGHVKENLRQIVANGDVAVAVGVEARPGDGTHSKSHTAEVQFREWGHGWRALGHAPPSVPVAWSLPWCCTTMVQTHATRAGERSVPGTRCSSHKRFVRVRWPANERQQVHGWRKAEFLVDAGTSQTSMVDWCVRTSCPLMWSYTARTNQCVGGAEQGRGTRGLAASPHTVLSCGTICGRTQSITQALLYGERQVGLGCKKNPPTKKKKTRKKQQNKTREERAGT